MNVTRLSFTAGLLVLGLTSQTPGPTLAQIPTESAPLPAEIQVPANQRFLLSLAATGDQIYTCQARADAPGQFAWTLKAPEALLYDTSGQEVGHHYGGPSWELNDGSKIVGQLKTRVDAPTTDAIPWLLLEVKSHEGSGMFQQVNWIQRVHTVGGKAPEAGCDATRQNQEVRVNYTADYYFYGN